MQDKESSLEITNHGNAIKFTLTVPVKLHKEGAWFYSSCRLFDVHSQGKSEAEAIKNIVEAVQLFVESCFGRGVLEQVLKDCGFKPASRQQTAVQKSITSSSERMIDVPLPLLVANHAQKAHAY